MNYDEIAEVIGHKLIEYNVENESFSEVYKKCLDEYGTFNSNEENKILTKVIHVITVMGYDIVSTKPCRFKKYL